MNARLARRVIPFVAFALFIGCGDGQLKTYKVSGQVLYNGQPLAGVDVAFHPVDAKNNTGYPPHATTDQEGKFLLMTYVKDDGAPVGEYQVAIAFPVETAGEEGSDQTKKLSFQVPAKYHRKETSEITAKVESRTNALEPFRLEGPPRPQGKR